MLYRASCFNCVCSCVEAEHDATINRLKDYKNYRSLTPEEESQLLILCLALTPDNLIGTIFFPNEDLQGCSNEFFELKAVNTRLVIAESLLIGGQQKRVHKIMMFKKKWIENNYINPMLSILQGQRPTQRRPLPRPPAQPSSRPPAQPSSRPPAQPSSRPPAQSNSRPPAQPNSRPLGQPIPSQPRPVSRQTSTQLPSSRPQAIAGLQTSPQAYPNPPTNWSQTFTQPSPRPTAQPTSRSLAQANSRPLAQSNSRPLGQPIPSQPRSVSRQTSTQRPSSRPQATGQQTSPQTYPNPPANWSQTSTQPSPRPPAQPSSRPPAQPNYRPLGQPTTRKKKCIIQ